MVHGICLAGHHRVTGGGGGGGGLSHTQHHRGVKQNALAIGQFREEPLVLIANEKEAERESWEAGNPAMLSGS